MKVITLKVILDNMVTPTPLLEYTVHPHDLCTIELTL